MNVFLKTLAARLTFWYAGIFVLFFAAAFMFFYVLIDSILDQRIDKDLEEDIVEFRLLWASEGQDRVKEEIERELLSSDPGEILLRILASDGNEIFAPGVSNRRGLTDKKALEKAAVGSDAIFTSVEGDEDEYPIRIAYGRIAPGAVLEIGESTEEKEEFMEFLFQVFATTFCVVILLAAGVGWFMAKRALRGVEEVSRAAMDVANGTLDRKVSVKTEGAEIERLVSTFNMMVERIRRLILGMREMTDNIAHDMRSPLARIRANSELTLFHAKTLDEYKESATDTLEECDRLLQMINTTLDVAEAEVGAADFIREDIDISELVKDAFELFEAVAENKDIELSLKLAPDCRVQGNARYLQRLLANLLDNALKFTPPKGRIELAVSSKHGTVSASVRDTGVGIADADQPHIFERFFRCDQSRSQPGFGLGLSLARAVARAHGGDLAVSSSPGEGSEFIVTLPSYG